MKRPRRHSVRSPSDSLGASGRITGVDGSRGARGTRRAYGGFPFTNRCIRYRRLDEGRLGPTPSRKLGLPVKFGTVLPIARQGNPFLRPDTPGSFRRPGDDDPPTSESAPDSTAAFLSRTSPDVRPRQDPQPVPFSSPVQYTCRLVSILKCICRAHASSTAGHPSRRFDETRARSLRARTASTKTRH